MPRAFIAVTRVCPKCDTTIEDVRVELRYRYFERAYLIDEDRVDCKPDGTPRRRFCTSCEPPI